MNKYELKVNFTLDANDSTEAENELYDVLFSHFRKDQFDIVDCTEVLNGG